MPTTTAKTVNKQDIKAAEPKVSPDKKELVAELVEELGQMIDDIFEDYRRFFPMPQDAYQFQRKRRGEYIPDFKERARVLLESKGL